MIQIAGERNYDLYLYLKPLFGACRVVINIIITIVTCSKFMIANIYDKMLGNMVADSPVCEMFWSSLQIDTNLINFGALTCFFF